MALVVELGTFNANWSSVVDQRIFALVGLARGACVTFSNLHRRPGR
jgi:hypothetical protein